MPTSETKETGPSPTPASDTKPTAEVEAKTPESTKTSGHDTIPAFPAPQATSLPEEKAATPVSEPKLPENEKPVDVTLVDEPPAEQKPRTNGPKPVWADKPADAKAKPAVPPKPASDGKPKPAFDPKSTLSSPKPTLTGPPPPGGDDVPDLAVLVRDSAKKPQLPPSAAGDDRAVLVKKPAPPRPPPPLRRTPTADGADVVPEVPPLPEVLKPVALAALVPDPADVALLPEAAPEQRWLGSWFTDVVVNASLAVAGIRCTAKEAAARTYEGRRPTWPPLTNLQGMSDDNYRLVSDYVGSIEAEARARYERADGRLRVLFGVTALVFASAAGLAVMKHPIFFAVATPLLFTAAVSLRALGGQRVATPALSHQEAFASRVELQATTLADRLKAANANASAADFMVDCFRAGSRYFGLALFAVPFALGLDARLFGPEEVRVHVQSIEPAAASALGAVPRPIVAEPPVADAGALPLAVIDAGASKDAGKPDAGEKLAETDAGATPAVAPPAPAPDPPPVVAPPVTPPPPAPVVAPPPAPKPVPSEPPAPPPEPAPAPEPKPVWERP